MHVCFNTGLNSEDQVIREQVLAVFCKPALLNNRSMASMRATLQYTTTKEKTHLLPFLFFILVLSCLFPALVADDEFDEPATLTVEHILNSHATVQDAPDRVHVELNVLGFATPWNSAGNQIALSESDKGRLNILSPVTYQMTGAGLSGGHDYTTEFYTAVNQSGTLIMPRVLFEASFFTTASSSSSSDPQATAQVLIDECNERGFAGLVIEAWQTLLALSEGSKMSQDSYDFIKIIGTTIREAGFRTVLVMPPYTQDVVHMDVSSKQIADMAIGYSYVVVMTYDFSTPASAGPGPLAPTMWMSFTMKYFTEKCGLREKVFLGLNFYGIDFVVGKDDTDDKKTQPSNNRHIVGHEFIKVLQTRDVEIKWHDSFKEHYFIYEEDGNTESEEEEEEEGGAEQKGKQHAILYPTRSSIRERVKLAREVKCGGVAIWDIGQGLNHFFEEF